MPQHAITLRSITSGFYGGREVAIADLPVEHRDVVNGAGAREVDMNGTYTVGQMYAQAYRLHTPRHPYPIVLLHGGGMTGAQWEATPDGRHGWLWRFLAAGFDVVVCDAAERGRASWAMFPQAYASAPLFRTKEEAWRLFRLGAAEGYSAQATKRMPFANQRFPLSHYDAFAKQFVARWLDHDAQTLAAYRVLLQEIGPCILIGHSQGGGYACTLAQDLPDQIKALIGVEPTGVPSVPSQSTLPPHLLLWGDHFEQSGDVWRNYRQHTDRYWDALQRTSTPAARLDLPAQGIKGNSHFCMLDDNSDEIAELLVKWLEPHL